MNEASLYSKYNSLQKHDAKFVIENYLRFVKWKNNENLLDIGSGDGDVIFELLLPKLPKNFNKLVATDISDEMVRFARSKCNNSKIDFLRFDISSPDLPPEFHEYFDHIFSFYCLHWVVEQRQAIKNMFDMLKPGGDMLLTFLASNPIYDIYERMARSNKWGPYMNNLKKYISPYHHLENPENQLESFLKKEGFICHLCRVEDRSYTFPNFTILSKSVSAVNPFIKKLPDGEIDNYIEDYIKEVRKLESITIETYSCNNNIEEKIHMPYKLFIAFASKPLQSIIDQQLERLASIKLQVLPHKYIVTNVKVLATCFGWKNVYPQAKKCAEILPVCS